VHRYVSCVDLDPQGIRCEKVYLDASSWKMLIAAV
jgi:hypothetical protein